MSDTATPRTEAKAGEMAKKVTTFAPGESETDGVVRRWLARNGIDQNAVSGYSIFRHQGEIPRIMLEMYFDDAPAVADVSRETSPAAQVYLIGERGPEPVRPGPTLITVLRADHQNGEHAKNRNGACPLCYPPHDTSAPDHRTENSKEG